RHAPLASVLSKRDVQPQPASDALLQQPDEPPHEAPVVLVQAGEVEPADTSQRPGRQAGRLEVRAVAAGVEAVGRSPSGHPTGRTSPPPAVSGFLLRPWNPAACGVPVCRLAGWPALPGSRPLINRRPWARLRTVPRQENTRGTPGA